MYQSNLTKGSRCLLSWNDDSPELLKQDPPEIIEVQKPIEIVNYNERSFAVIGEGTKGIKDDLRNLGGSWNKFLKCGPGWIFSNKRLPQIQLLLNK
jgi:hypothetical protein